MAFRRDWVGGKNKLDGAVSKLLSAASAHVAQTTFRNVGNGSRDGTPKIGSVGSDCLVEVTDLKEAVVGDPDSEAWAGKVKHVLQQFFKKFGPVLGVRVPTAVASVRFVNAKSANDVMRAFPRGYLTLGDVEVRVRLPGSSEAVWRKFPPLRKAGADFGGVEAAAVDPIASAAKKRKLRPNSRFATKLPGREEEPYESERFWEEQHERRREPAPPLPAVEPPTVQEPPAPAPEKPVPRVAALDAAPEDLAVSEGEKAVSVEMRSLLELPFSQQKKSLKALRRSWHPDKRPDDQDVATRVFQFIQSHDDWLAYHGLA